MQQIALLGTGIMGAGIGKNLLKAGYALAVYNRTAEKAQPLVDAGARLAATPRAAATGADLVLAMVGNDDASRAMWQGEDGALAGVKAGAVLVDSSTLTPGWVRELAGLVDQRGCVFLDAPVTGSKPAAEAGELVLLVGGPAEALERARPVLAAFSQKINHFGPVGSGAIAKLLNNLLAAVQAASLAEALALAERTGLDMAQVVPFLINGAPGSPIVKGKAARMVARDYGDTQFALKWMHKDASYGLQLGDEHGQPMPILAVAREVYRMARNKGLDDADFAAVIEALRGA